MRGYVYPLFEEFRQVEAKLDSMDRKDIDISVISPAPPMFYYWADAHLALEVGRLVHGHKMRGEANGVTKSSPKELLKRVYFDSLVFEPKALRYLIDLVGADHVCIGTDAPFDMADGDPKATIEAVPDITPLERQCVCCGTALKLLREG